MSEEIVVQLFWFLFMVTVFIGILVIGAILFHQLERWEYRSIIKHQKARQRWAEMMEKPYERD